MTPSLHWLPVCNLGHLGWLLSHPSPALKPMPEWRHTPLASEKDMNRVDDTPILQSITASASNYSFIQWVSFGGWLFCWTRHDWCSSTKIWQKIVPSFWCWALMNGGAHWHSDGLNPFVPCIPCSHPTGWLLGSLFCWAFGLLGGGSPYYQRGGHEKSCPFWKKFGNYGEY